MLAFVPVAPSAKPSRSLGRLAFHLAVLIYFIAGLGYLGLRYYVWPHIDDWRGPIVSKLSVMAGRPISIVHLRAGFDGLQPQLIAEGVTIRDDDGKVLLRVPQARAVLSLRTFITGVPRLSTLQFDAPDVTVEKRNDGRWLVGGILMQAAGNDSGGGPDWLMAQRRILVQDGTLRWIDRSQGIEQNFSGVELVLGSVGRRHRAALRVPMAGDLAGDLNLVGEFYRPPRSRPSAWENWHGEVYAAAARFDSAMLQKLTGWSLPVVGAHGDFKLWSRFDHGRPDDLLVKLAGQDIGWLPPALTGEAAAGQSLRIRNLVAQVQATRAKGGGFELQIDGLQAQADSGLALRGRGPQRLWLDEQGQPRSGRIALEPFDVRSAVALALTLPWPGAVLERLRQVTTRGDISRLDLAFNRSPELTFDAEVEFSGLAVVFPPERPAQPVAGEPLPLSAPSLENVSGSARIREDQGDLTLTGQGAAVTFPGLFDEPRVPLDRLQAKAHWQLAIGAGQPALSVQVEQLKFANADAAGSVAGSYRSGGKGPGIVDIEGRLDRAEARRTARYLPSRIGGAVRDWVAHSITAGKSSDVRFRLKGDLNDFPFRNPALGDFSIEAKVTEGNLAYAPGWPAIDRFDGTLLFERAGMDITMRAGRVYGVTLNDTQARIADFQQSLLIIEGSGHGPAQEMIRFVNESPLATRIDDFTRDARAEGNARLQLKLALPLSDLAASKVAGTVIFNDNSLALDKTLPPLTNVTGRLEFTDHGLALRDIGSTFLGSPLKVEGETAEAGRFSLRAQGTVSAENMRTVIDNPLTQRLSGRAEYRATLDVRRRAATVTVESDLVGLASSLPAPFDKPAEAKWPLLVRSQPVAPGDPNERSESDTVSATLKGSFRLVFERSRDASNQKLTIQRGAFAINSEPVMPERGFAVLLNHHDIDIDQWGAVLNGAPSRPAANQPLGDLAEGFSVLPSLVSVVADRVKVGGKDLHDVVFGATRLGGFWRANISAREINGFFNWREAAAGQRIGTLTARFARLEIPPSRRQEIESLMERPADELPALDIAAEEFILGEQKLGSLKVLASATGSTASPVWNLKELRVENPAGILKATGVYAPAGAGSARHTRLDYQLDIKDSGELLATFGVKGAVRGGIGKIDGNIGWKGSPLALDYGSLEGMMKLDVGKGQFLKTEPGIGKLIGVLNLQSLPRRLSLDFRDVFAEGFAFDQIEGEAQIDHGIARTDALSMRGIQAQVRISGEADLSRETQALLVQVRPELNAGLASLAYAAVNPVLGLGTFVAQLVLRKPLQQLFTYEYEVKGSWTDPQVAEKRRFVQQSTSPIP